MAISIDENLLITLISIFFVPIVGVVAKMFIQLRQNQSKIEEISDIKANGSDLVKRVSALENEMSGLRETIKGLADVLGRTRDYVLKQQQQQQQRKTNSNHDNGFIG